MSVPAASASSLSIVFLNRFLESLGPSSGKGSTKTHKSGGAEDSMMPSSGLRCLTCAPISTLKAGATASTLTVESGKLATKSILISSAPPGSTYMLAPSTCSVRATIGSKNALCHLSCSAR
jgi:hypothetical protein